MMYRTIHITETDSTNRYLRELGGDDDVCVYADFQTAGRGCGTNRWESERGQNLLFSLRLHPVGVKASEQYIISVAASVAIARALIYYGVKEVSIKWPNDIYAGDRKICGILIENRLSGNTISESIVGVGLNVNQTHFVSDAPNPVSMRQLTGQETALESLLGEILTLFTLDQPDELRQTYRQLLYRRTGLYPYSDAGGRFEAELAGVEDDGHLVLHDTAGRERRYAFKEVSFLNE